MTEQTIHIEKMVGNGWGIGRLEDGMIVMLPYVLSGEKIAFKKIKRHKDYIEAVPVEIISSSAHRIKPICQHFGTCGGCDYQHADYDHQLSIKQSVMLEQLKRVIKKDETLLDEIWQGITPSSRQFSYRQRIRLHVSIHGEIGFFRSKSNIPEIISRCPLARKEINEILLELQNNQSAIHILGKSKEFEIISSIGDKGILLIFHLKEKPRAADIKAVRALIADFSELKSILIEGDGFQRQVFCDEATKGDDCAHIVLPFDHVNHKSRPYEMVLEAGSFSQVNHEVNQAMIVTMIDWVRSSGSESVLDMFCGIGNFSIPLAMDGYKVTGFDLQRSAIRSAHQNAAQLGLECDFFRASSDEGLGKLNEKGEFYDILIIDPPRRGCPESLANIIKSGCRSIIYVSCDPATLCRDLGLFIEEGFSLVKVAGFDMFPQTYHLETMAMLTR